MNPKREQYCAIRYDYYHAGRLLHLIGNFHSAGIMLGYTIETIMKVGLIEVLTEAQQEQKKKILKSHDVRRIFLECRKCSLFDGVQVSEDFLEHINYYFQRYPSQMEKVLQEADKKDNVIGNSTEWIHYYDDFVVQLDYHLLKRINNPSVSIIYLALINLDTRYARDILRNNPFALLKFEEYKSIIQENLPEREDLRKNIEVNLEKGAIFYWDPDSKVQTSQENLVSMAKKYSASTFRLPKWTNLDGYRQTVIP